MSGLSVPEMVFSTLPTELPGELELVACWREEVRCFSLPRTGSVTLGRAADNAVAFEDPSLSRRHAVLHVGERLVIEDLGGPNGTSVRDASHAGAADDTVNLRQLAGTSAEIRVGESVTLGSVTIAIRRVERAVSGFFRLGGDAAAVSSPALRGVCEQAERAARSPITVLILGETGVGKEVLARSIHAASPGAKQPFMGINCAALGETLLEGELFGYERGAFTGATQARAGLFEAADGGSVFLDEIGELPLTTQAKLLRVLEERAVMRLGARSVRKIDARFIAATNRDLEAEVRAGRFRQDLFFRLNGIILTIPPLRERREEIEPLARAFAAKACRELDRPAPLALSAEVLETFRRYPWPGNVRELRNVIERAAVLCSHATIGVADLPAALVAASGAESQPASSGSVPPRAPSASTARPIQDEIRMLERLRITEALKQCRGNQTQAAKLLGMSRRTLIARLAEFDLPRPRLSRK